MDSFELICFIAESFWEVGETDATMLMMNERLEDTGAGASMWPDCVSPEVVLLESAPSELNRCTKCCAAGSHYWLIQWLLCNKVVISQ